MRNCFHDDAHPGQQFGTSKVSWLKRWVVRPLKAVFVAAPVKFAKALWAETKPRLNALKLVFSSPVRVMGTLLLTGIVTWFYFVAQPLFWAAVFTAAGYAVFGLSAWLALAFMAAFKSTPKDRAAEQKIWRQGHIDSKLATAQADSDMLEKEAQAAAEIRLAEQLNRAKRDKLAFDHYNKLIASLPAEDKNLLDSCVEIPQLPQPNSLKQLLDNL